MRLAMGLEYAGSAYNGWQRQKSGIGVQAVAETAVSRVANHPVELICAGRTDTGVHATGQVVHFDTESERTRRAWLLGVNSNLPDDVSVTWVQAVPEDFHARFSATARTYRYLILNRLVRSALFRRRAWWVHQALDAERMQIAGQALLGEHDFSAFRAAGCQSATPVREVTELAVEREGDWLAVTISANAFLQHMVRNIVGSLVAVGCGDEAPAWIGELLAGRNRTQAGVAAPPHGLTLMRVSYPANYAIASPAVETLLPGLIDTSTA